MKGPLSLISKASQILRETYGPDKQIRTRNAPPSRQHRTNPLPKETSVFSKGKLILLDNLISTPYSKGETQNRQER